MPFDSCRFDVYYDNSDPNYTGTGRFDYSNYVPPSYTISKIDYAKESNAGARTMSITNTDKFNISITNTSRFDMTISNDAAD